MALNNDMSSFDRPKDAMAAIRKRLTSSTKNFHVINLTLTVSTQKIREDNLSLIIGTRKLCEKLWYSVSC